MNLRRAIAVSPLLVCTALGCATSRVDIRSSDLEGWLQLRASDFELTGDVPRDELKRFAEDLAIFVAVLERITNASESKARVPARIYLVSGRVGVALNPWSGIAGYMAQRLDGYYCIVDRQHMASITREVLLHEYTHFLVRKGRGLDYPTWYDEGFAEVLSTTRSRQGLVSVGTPAAGRLQSLAKLGEIDLAAIFSLEQYSDSDNLLGFYAMSWAATHYLATHGDTAERMGRLVQLQSQGVDWQEAYGRTFDQSLESLNQAVRHHVDGLARGALLTVATFDLDELAVDRDWKIRALAPLEVARELGELGLAVLTSDQADVPTAFFDRALEIAPGDGRARAGLAVSLALGGDFPSAEAQISTALAALPDDPQVLRAAGRVRRAQAETSDDPAAVSTYRRIARDNYQRATQLDPEMPSAWAGLGWSYVGDDDPDLGIAALNRAIAIGAWDSNVALDLGRMYHGAGDESRARELWLQVSRLGDEDEADEADRLLEALPVALSP
jgi:Flp pilus assembly protein TadD